MCRFLRRFQFVFPWAKQWLHEDPVRNRCRLTVYRGISARGSAVCNHGTEACNLLISVLALCDNHIALIMFGLHVSLQSVILKPTRTVTSMWYYITVFCQRFGITLKFKLILFVWIFSCLISLPKSNTSKNVYRAIFVYFFKIIIKCNQLSNGHVGNTYIV